MDHGNSYKPFAITAKTLGFPRKLYTPLLLVNLRSSEKLAAAYVNAMWNTGAETCVMSKTLADRLGFEFDKTIPSRGLTGESIVSYGTAYVALKNNGDLIDTTAAIVDDISCGDEYSFIIGMDFIRKGTLAISCTPLATVLTFTIPTTRELDFVKDIDCSGDSKGYIPLSSTKESRKVYFGQEVLDLLK